MGRGISYLLTLRRPITQLRSFFYSILLEFGTPKKLARLIKMCLNETYSKIFVGKLLSDKLPIQMG
jgi:hypothetical protein